LANGDQITEARAIAALYMTRERLKANEIPQEVPSLF